ncbi:MAG: hypothetical protein PSX81_11320 [bacterium]|nr:hypothetical protein [bacterium]
MGILTRRKSIPGVDFPSQFIRIKKGKGIDAKLSLITFIDNDTKQHIAFCPALDITGYGSTIDRANEMFEFNLDNFYEHIYSLSPEKQNAELIKLGWKRDAFKNKNYSSVSVNIDGELENFNIEEGSLKRLSLELTVA